MPKVLIGGALRISRSRSMAAEEMKDTKKDDRVLWATLLKLADANLSQARTNKEASRGMHFLIQCMISRGYAIDMIPDRLESWYAAESDAEAGVSIAGKSGEPRIFGRLGTL